jgi:hypothetical protein
MTPTEHRRESRCGGGRKWSRALVDKPDSVRVNETERRGMTVLELTTAPGDMGKIIGGRAGRPPRCARWWRLTAEKHGSGRSWIFAD